MAAKPSYRIQDGFRVPLGFPAENFSSALAYEAQPGDIFLSTYPKCGTTWVQYILYLLFHDGVPLPAGELIGNSIPHLEETGAEFVRSLPSPRVIKTHFTYEQTPSHPDARYITIARNPFDCVVSFYHHTRGFERHYEFSDGTFDDYFECFIAGEVDWGDYFDCLASWFAHRDDENVLFLTYEGMKQDSRKAISEIASFLDLPSAHDESKLAEIDRHSSFNVMRGNLDRWSSRRPADMPAFIRKGEVGDWLNHFSADQAHRLAEKFDRVAKSAGFSKLWPEILDVGRGMT
ncbi:MAG: sulfotransferase domain-containing protein [Candidatus Rariloculaceae bacterium]